MLKNAVAGGVRTQSLDLHPSATGRATSSPCSCSGRHSSALSTSAQPISRRLMQPVRTTRCHRSNTTAASALPLFDPPPFQPSKLSVSYASGASSLAPSPPDDSRRYTLTHNDVTGQLWLTVGVEYNRAQISGFYTRLLRDEVIAEWQSSSDEAGGEGADEASSLHLYCHVSGEEKWLAPPMLRNYIFRREIPLVRACTEALQWRHQCALRKHRPGMCMGGEGHIMSCQSVVRRGQAMATVNTLLVFTPDHLVPSLRCWTASCMPSKSFYGSGLI